MKQVILKNWEEKIKRKYLIYKENRYEYDFQQYETIIVQMKLNLLVIWQILMIDLGQKQQKVKTKKILRKVHIFFMKVENELLQLSEVEYFQ